MMRKAVIITTVIIFLMAMTGLIIATSKSSVSNPDQMTDAQREVIKNLTETQKIFTKLVGQDVEVEKIGTEYLEGDNTIEITIHSTEGKIAKEGSQEAIYFNVYQEEDSETNIGHDFVYHETINNKDTFILQSSENSYQHYNGYTTNEFDTLYKAIEDHQLFRPEE